ncbi:uracil-DNA glycosylase [Zhengella mangrovi]|uniref:Type-4 uracil-DNA glycosylase n=1 Tax=Zhengella mangrovi TaxID=1982044 RepID=A0A2G1QIM7_9HYPH|nr:UdgX family uracil-DNA binding protein [Zhengella mangrovi]PHP65304.1 uracil-DNA glycosylase [Zhengella mangrovi]
MHHVRLPRIGTIAAWRSHARTLLGNGAAPEEVLWSVGEASADLFADDAPALPAPGATIRVPRSAVEAIETALCHRDGERFSHGYAALVGLHRRRLRWGDRSDSTIGRLLKLEKAVRRDIHKMHAFVRFREVGPVSPGRRAFAAWFEPDHHVVETAAPFFARRFGDMDWVIATPDLTAKFEGGNLSFEETRDRTPPPPDASEELWRTYFSSIFNPARLMVSAMTSEMPKKYWKNLPEADLIPGLIRAAPERARRMQEAMPSAPPSHVERMRFVRPAAESPDGDLSLQGMKPALDACRRCPLGQCATQAVAGEGPQDARLMIVGEQPGDTEDLAGRPFVGPAGKVLDQAMTDAGLDRDAVYLTNAVKHFKFEPRGKRRLHRRPDTGEVTACRWWLDFEVATVAPKLLVAMGSTAALALTGQGGSIEKRRGTIEHANSGQPVLLTWHPAYLLRIREPSVAAEARQRFVDDLARAKAIVGA